MDEGNFSVIEQYFHKALALPAESRLEFLKKSLPDQPDIQKAVMSLLQHTNETRSLSQMVDQATQNVFDAQQDLSGTMAGAYKLIECIETGGMGAVYIAERADKQYEKKVAVKLIRSMSSSDYLLTRFKEERQTLANLEHYNITRLIDGGTTDAGVPFLVMEYVEGVAIDQYCEQHQLTIKQRLKLFVKVCEAIQYAHQNLVVHCDLKPENVLVNQDGEPKVMDFGISHLLSKTELDTDAPRLLTIQYASPEQISGGTISVSCDIYALGAVLFKMLSGAITLPGDKISKEQVLEYIQSHQISAVSEQASKSQVPYYQSTASLIGADLDAIVAKALQAQVANRYDSAGDFAEDIARLIAQYPVHARSASWQHRSALYFRRNAIAASLGAVLGLSILSASSAIWYQSEQLKQERDTAQTEQQKAQAVTTFITDMFEGIHPDSSQGKEVTVLSMLQSATAKLDDPNQSSLGKQPIVLAKIRETIGTMYWRIGNLQESIEQLELAVKLHQQHPGQDIKAQISALNSLSSAYSLVDRNSERLDILETVIAKATEIYGKKDKLTIGYILNLGGYYNNIYQPQKAIEIHLQVLEDARQYLGEKSRTTVLALASLGNDYLRYGDFKTATKYFNEALTLAREALGNENILVIYSLERLATIYNDEKQFAKSKPVIEELLALANAMLGPDHKQTHAAQALYAEVLSSEQRYTEALQLLNQSLQTLPTIIGKDHFQVIDAQSKKVATLAKLSSYNEAIILSLDLIDRMTEKFGELEPRTLLEYQQLAEVYAAAGEQEKAIETYNNLEAKWQRFASNLLYDIATKADSLYLIYTQLSAYYLKNGQPLKCISSLKQAIEASKQYPEQDYPELKHNIQQLIALMQEHMPDTSTQDYIAYLGATS